MVTVAEYKKEVKEEIKDNNNKAVVVLSGGLDSTVLAYYLKNKGYDIYAISFDYNQKHKKELTCAYITANKICKDWKVVDLSILNNLAPSALTRDSINIPEGYYAEESMKSTVVPNRNMVLLSLAASYSISIGSSILAYGAHGGDHAIYPDCRQEFISAMKVALSICDWTSMDLLVPFMNWTKSSIVKKGIELNVPFKDTWTCYNGRLKACGVCGSCTERLEAFKVNNLEDPIDYE